MTGLVEGKVAIVTGGAGALGSATCEALAAQGSIVHCLDQDQERCDEVVSAISDAGGTASSQRCDVADRTAVFDVFRTIARQRGRLDIVVNTAMWINYRPIPEFDEPTIDRMLSVGLKGSMWTTQAAAELMPSAGGGAIINFSSTTSFRTSPGHFVYASIKGAINAMTMQTAVELGPLGIRVNAIAPGLVVHPGNASRLSDDFVAVHERTTPLSRLGAPDDIAAAVVFLSSDLSRWVSGVTLPVDGGRLNAS